jgi:hypothetical protein
MGGDAKRLRALAPRAGRRKAPERPTSLQTRTIALSEMPTHHARAGQMTFVIVRTTDKDKTAMRRRTLLPEVKTHAQAVALLEKDLHDYKKHGKDDEQGQWWAQNDSGEQFTFWIEGE